MNWHGYNCHKSNQNEVAFKIVASFLNRVFIQMVLLEIIA